MLKYKIQAKQERLSNVPFKTVFRSFKKYFKGRKQIGKSLGTYVAALQKLH